MKNWQRPQNVLYSTNCPENYIPPVPMSDRMIICGPAWQTREDSGNIVSINTPRVYDIAELIRKIPDNQRPDLLVVRTCSGLYNIPINLDGVTCPKVLLYADTHHFIDPIQAAIRYINSEKFDYVVLMYNHQHLHWFKEAGIDNVFFIPGFEAQDVNVEFQHERSKQVVFVGNIGDFHPLRKWYIEEIKRRGYPFHVDTVSRERTADIYSRSLITFNHSLNADLNMRVFEALNAGAFLVTDKISHYSGFNEMFVDGEHLVTYSSPGELFEKFDYYLDHAGKAIEIAKNGHDIYLKQHGSRSKIDALLGLIFGGENLPTYGHKVDPRSSRMWLDGSKRLIERLTAYEYLQELHRCNLSLKVLCWNTTDLCCDLVDLPRLDLHILVDSNFSSVDVERLAEYEAKGEIKRIDLTGARSPAWDVLILGKDVNAGNKDLRELNYRLVIFADLSMEEYPNVTKKMAINGYRLVKIGSPIFHSTNANSVTQLSEALMKPNILSLTDRIEQIRKEITRIHGWIHPLAGATLYRLVRLHIPIPIVVELGSWTGLAAAWMALSVRDRNEGRIYSVETTRLINGNHQDNKPVSDKLQVQLHGECLQNLESLGVSEYVELISSDAAAMEKNWPDDRKIGLLFIDASHNYETVKKTVELWLPHLTNGGFIVFDYVPNWPIHERLVSDLSLSDCKFIQPIANNWIFQKIAE